MTDAPSPILDYASPRPRQRMRLPASSVLAVRVDPDQLGLTVVEKLHGIPQAIVAMAFAVGVLLIVGAVAGAELVHRWGKYGPANPSAIILGLFWMAEAALLAIVIDRTWRRTILEARDGRLTLRFVSPLGTREHRWPFDHIGEIDVVATQEAVGVYTLAELRFRAADDVPVHLFTDHRANELVSIQSLLMHVLRYERAFDDSPGVLVTTIAPPAPAAAAIEPPDGRTTGRLVTVRNTLRQRAP